MVKLFPPEELARALSQNVQQFLGRALSLRGHGPLELVPLHDVEQVWAGLPVFNRVRYLKATTDVVNKDGLLQVRRPELGLNRRFAQHRITAISRPNSLRSHHHPFELILQDVPRGPRLHR